MLKYPVWLLLVLAVAGCGGTDWNRPWRDANGTAVDTRVVHTGEPECLEKVVVLYLGWPLGTRTSFKSDVGRYYARNPDGYLNTVRPFQENVRLPVTARDTGYRLGEIELWIKGSARDAVFIVHDDRAELWPRLEERIGCA